MACISGPVNDWLNRPLPHAPAEKSAPPHWRAQSVAQYNHERASEAAPVAASGKNAESFFDGVDLTPFLTTCVDRNRLIALCLQFSQAAAQKYVQVGETGADPDV
jgi:hypothetical protein